MLQGLVADDGTKWGQRPACSGTGVRFGRERIWGWLWRSPKDGISSGNRGDPSSDTPGRGCSQVEDRGDEEPGASSMLPVSVPFEDSQKIREEVEGGVCKEG